MKIAASDITSFSESFFNQADLKLNQKTKEKHIRAVNVPENRNTGGPPGIRIDRISIETEHRYDFQYNYSGSLKTGSAVKSAETGNIEKNETEAVIETLVGGVIDKTVVIQNIPEKKDILPLETDRPVPEETSAGGQLTAPPFAGARLPGKWN